MSGKFVVDLQNKINRLVQENVSYKNTAFHQPILVTGGRAALVYETLGNDEEKFRLKTDLFIYKSKEKKSYFSPNPYVKVDCQDASPEPLSRDQWAKDDYRLVKTQLDSMLAECEKKVLANLPELLKS
ncbi:hypothetical protein [Herbaspirillum sp. RV1423]|uniref:hypothetical protein n=1 Tax=Herbaspirillum sp. RV1423 TaxID=1443993 RepID=UPI0005599502|nr:hypothetical protein [Herbaspirillum sp. RV1423]